jgi:hypothetical protein
MKLVNLLALFLLAPSVAYAQGSIAGVVKDASGAVLPGVTVEASSPVLIEKVRTVVTDGTGQYKIVDLRPGTYGVTFTLTGFSTVKREGIELTGSFAAAVNVELKVGAVEETITVTGESPTVDVQSVTQQRVMSKDVLDSIPSGRSHFNVTVLLPGVTTSAQDVGGTNSLQLTNISVHGGSTGDTRVQVDGISTQNNELTGNSSNYLTNMGSTQELAVDYASGTADQAYGGLRINLIPREGGNRFSASLFATGANDKFQSSNFTDDLKARGLATPSALNYSYDVNPSGGGPIVKEKLWFYTAARFVGTNQYAGGRFYNLNAGDPNSWTYAPDTSRPAFDKITQEAVNGRVTWQANPKNKFSFFYDTQGRCWCNLIVFAAVPPSPEAAWRLEWPDNRLTTFAWSSPLTNRVLLEVRASDRAETFDYVAKQPDGSPNFNLIQVVDQATGMAYRSMGSNTTQPFNLTPSRTWNALASLSYVTGSHAFKFGFTDTFGTRKTEVRDNDYHVTYRFNAGIPNQITERATPWYHNETQRGELSLYAQDKWTIQRLTLNVGVRYDSFNTYYPAETLGPAPLVPNRNVSFPETQWLDFKDLTPRVGASYDLFGNGKTAVKATINRYTQAVGIGGSGPYGESGNPTVRLANTVTRSWNDTTYPAGDPRRSNFVPDCNLLSPLANGECGAMSDQNFGNSTPTTNYDPALIAGWGVRPYQWEFSTSVQQEVSQRVSLNVGYFRRIFGNFLVTDNRSAAPSDYSPFSFVAPLDPRLPGGGGYTVSGVYDLNPDKVGLVDNLVTSTGNYGFQMQHWNGIDASINARLSGITVQGGVSTGRTSTDNCDVVAKVDNPSLRFCHVDTIFLTQLKLLGVYTVPKVDVQASATFQSLPGPPILANYNVPNALVQPSLGRPLSGGAANITVNLVEPGTMYGERLNQLDLRFAKILKFGRNRTAINLDLYNALNGSAVITQNNNFATWQVPISILQARLVKFSVQFDF